MKRTVRFTALVLIVALCVCAFAGCVNKQSWAVKSDGGKHSISAAMYIYLLEQNKSSYLQSNSLTESEDMWDEQYTDEYTLGQYLQAYTLETLVSYIIWRQQFDNLGLSFTEAEEAAIQAEIDAMLEESGGETVVKESLRENGLDYDDYMDLVYYDTQKVYKVVDYYFGENGIEPANEEDVKAYFEENYARCKHILISSLDSDGYTVTGDEMLKVKQTAQEVYDLAKKADDAAFDKLIEQYNEDEGVAAYPDGYVFTTGEMVDSFEKAAFDMEVGETRLVESEYGFHIMRKLTLEDEQVFTDEVRRQLLTQLKSTELAELYDQWTEDIPVKVNRDVFKKYTCASIGTAEEQEDQAQSLLDSIVGQLGLEESEE